MNFGLLKVCVPNPSLIKAYSYILHAMMMLLVLIMVVICRILGDINHGFSVLLSFILLPTGP